MAGGGSRPTSLCGLASGRQHLSDHRLTSANALAGHMVHYSNVKPHGPPDHSLHQSVLQNIHYRTVSQKYIYSGPKNPSVMWIKQQAIKESQFLQRTKRERKVRKKL